MEIVAWSAWVRGAALGLAVAAPVGPIGVLCIRRTLNDGRLTGFISGLGAATADAAYGASAAFGLTLVSSLLLGARLWVHLVGTLFLCYLGARTALARPATAPARASAKGLASAYASTMALTLTSPATVITFAIVFAGLGLVGGTPAVAALTVLGVFTGSALWWLALSTCVGLLRARFTPGAMRWVNRVSGVMLIGFGIVALATAGR
ncbi:MAG TPA: LysE family transporter [Ktedonobacterales bacterium]|nr:LysE family transporter [Ktedonobacterales bacterium]